MAVSRITRPSGQAHLQGKTRMTLGKELQGAAAKSSGKAVTLGQRSISAASGDNRSFQFA